MLDLNHILLFIALATPVILLWRLRRLGQARPGGWIAAALIVLVGTGLSYFFVPTIAGFLGGGIWALLLLVPSVAERKIADLLVRRRYRAASRRALGRRGGAEAAGCRDWRGGVGGGPGGLGRSRAGRLGP